MLMIIASVIEVEVQVSWSNILVIEVLLGRFNSSING